MYSRIILDAGHGPNNTRDGVLDSGAVFGPMTEYGFVRQIVADAVHYFASTPLEVIQTPEIRLSALIDWYNRRYRPGDALVAVHINKGPLLATGTEVVIDDHAPSWRKGEATVLGSAVAQVLGIPFRRVLKDTESERKQLGLLSHTVGPAFILEMGFITNQRDTDALKLHGTRALIEGVWALTGRREEHSL